MNASLHQVAFLTCHATLVPWPPPLQCLPKGCLPWASRLGFPSKWLISLGPFPKPAADVYRRRANGLRPSTRGLASPQGLFACQIRRETPATRRGGHKFLGQMFPSRGRFPLGLPTLACSLCSLASASAFVGPAPSAASVSFGYAFFRHFHIPFSSRSSKKLSLCHPPGQR